MEANISLPSRPARSALNGRSILVLVVATLLVPLAAHLSPTEYLAGSATEKVSYAYGDVTSTAGVPALYRRFEVEAADLCAEVAGTADRRSQLDCVEIVIDHAVRDIAAPKLTAYHQARQHARLTRVSMAAPAVRREG